MLAQQGIPLASRPVAAVRNQSITAVHYSKRLDRRRHKIETLALFPTEGRRRLATRYDRWAHVFRFAILLAATVLFW